MFHRVVYEDSTAWFTIVAFAFAASIFITISWRALRMKRAQIEHYENLPFLTATPACVRRGSDTGTDGPGLHSTNAIEPLNRT